MGWRKQFRFLGATRCLCFALTCSTLSLAELKDRLGPHLDHPAIQYRVASVTDPVRVLNLKLQRGEIELRYEGAHGYLRALLESLNVPIESQIAVFSKTSQQASLIEP